MLRLGTNTCAEEMDDDTTGVSISRKRIGTRNSLKRIQEENVNSSTSKKNKQEYPVLDKEVFVVLERIDVSKLSEVSDYTHENTGRIKEKCRNVNNNNTKTQENLNYSFDDKKMNNNSESSPNRHNKDAEIATEHVIKEKHDKCTSKEGIEENNKRKKLLNEKCSICDKIVQWSEINSHMDFHRTSQKKCVKYNCIVCNESFGKKFPFLQHMIIHDIVKQFKCKLCDYSFSVKSDLLKHEKDHNSDQFFPFSQCSACSPVHITEEHKHESKEMGIKGNSSSESEDDLDDTDDSDSFYSHGKREELIEDMIELDKEGNANNYKMNCYICNKEFDNINDVEDHKS